MRRAEIEKAAERIEPWVRRTPLMALEPEAFDVSGRVFLKLELMQHTGSFKPRGAFNAMLAAPVSQRGVVAASGGNFGLAVAYAARALGHRAEIYVPETSPAVKIDRIRAYGARTHVVPGYYADALAACIESTATTDATFLHAFDQPAIVAGQGTLGRELDEQLPEVDTVLVAVGGGGLIAGVAAWFESSARVVSVEPERCPTLHSALAQDGPVDVDVGGIAADSLGARRAGALAVDIAARHVAASVLVTDEAIGAARALLWQELRIAAEPGAAAPLAALLEGVYRPAPDEVVAVVVCGGNADPYDLTFR